jgi:hypothetical protein
MKIVSSITRPEGSSESKGARAKASNVTFSKHTRTILHDHHEECMNISFLLVGQAKKIMKLYLLVDGFISQTPMSREEEAEIKP